MKEVKVLGSGCARCHKTEEMIAMAGAELGVDISLEPVTDFAQIAQYGVVSTPAVVIDGKVVHAGGLPSAEAVRHWLVG